MNAALVLIARQSPVRKLAYLRIEDLPDEIIDRALVDASIVELLEVVARVLALVTAARIVTSSPCRTSIDFPPAGVETVIPGTSKRQSESGG